MSCNFNQVVFTDETAICVSQRGSQYVRRGSGQRLRWQDLSLRTSSPQKVMFWGCFSFMGVGPLHLCQGSVNSQYYISILDSCILPQTANWYGNSNWILLQDNAPCHNSKMTKEWLQNHQIEVMNWPANSPDLNPIENMWGYIKQKLLRVGSHSKVDLINNVKKFWNKKTFVRH